MRRRLRENQLAVTDRVDVLLGYWDKDLRCRSANAAYRVWFGKSPDEILGKHLAELLGPLFELNFPHICAALDGEVQVFEREILLPDGSLRDGLASYYPHIVGRKVVGFSVQVANVTQMKKLERELSGRLIDAQEQERSRIARELHDDISQQIAIMAIALQQLKSSVPGESSGSKKRIDAIWRKTRAVSQSIQDLSHQLHSSELDHLGIVVALRGLCNEVSKLSRIEIEFQFKEVPRLMDPDISLAIFRVAQECLHNITKHAKARRVYVELLGMSNSVLLRVADDGIGFDPDAFEHKYGLGMISMRERIRSVGGTINFLSQPSLGTQVVAIIPIDTHLLP